MFTLIPAQKDCLQWSLYYAHGRPRADPPYTQNTQAAWDPETPGGPLPLKDDFILVSFLNLARGNMKDNLL